VIPPAGAGSLEVLGFLEVGNNALDGANRWIKGYRPAESKPRVHTASAPWDICRSAGRGRMGSITLALLVLFAMLMSSIERSPASHSQRPSECRRRHFALRASDFSRLSVTALITREDAVVTVGSEDDEEDDETSSATRHPHETYDPSFSPSRSAPAWNLGVPSRLSALRPLRC
jgi:hypothetical protein